MWRCPRCGHRFVTAHIWHSCSHHRLAEHFAGQPALRRLFARYAALVRRNGPVTIIPQKTRIVFQGRVRFAGAIVRKGWIEGGMWLRRRVADPRFHRIETYSRSDFGHYFRLARPADLDAQLARYLAEAYAVGRGRTRGPRAAAGTPRSRGGPRRSA
jgi:hypothetical protein